MTTDMSHSIIGFEMNLKVARAQRIIALFITAETSPAPLTALIAASTTYPVTIAIAVGAKPESAIIRR